MADLLSAHFLSDEQLRALGCVQFESSILEHAADVFIPKLSKMDERLLRIFIPEKQLLGSKLSTIKKLVDAKATSNEVKTEYEKIHSEIMTAVNNRNKLTHGMWQLEIWEREHPETEYVFRPVLTKKNGEVLTYPDNIIKTAHELQRARQMLNQFFAEHRDLFE